MVVLIAVSALADYDGRPGGIGVAGTCRAGADDSIADFSNYGSAVNIAAPGGTFHFWLAPEKSLIFWSILAHP